MWSHVRRNYQAILNRIDAACETVGRDPESVTLIAVSKTFPVEAIRVAYDLGHRHFGESRLQEAQPKIDALPEDIVWHFIGGLQSNKAKRVSQIFDVVHTFDSEAQLREAAKGRIGQPLQTSRPSGPEPASDSQKGLIDTGTSSPLDGLIEVNIGEEPQKSGILPMDLDSFHQKLLDFPLIRFRGLMTIGPATENPEQTRPFFRMLREANSRLGGQWLSMGMSGDFEVAIHEGASHIRIGTALFGER